MITPNELREFELEHFHGGVGWVMVEDVDAEYCRVAPVSKGDVQYRAFLAAKDRLKVWVRIDQYGKPYRSKITNGAALAVSAMREGIRSGNLLVEQSHVIEAKHAKAAMAAA